MAVNLARLLGADAVDCRTIGSREIALTQSEAPARLASILEPGDSLVVTSALTPDKGRDVNTLMKNLRMAENLCVALVKSPCAHLVYISSDAVYDGRSTLIDEQSSREPADLYGLMHTARELMLAESCRIAKIPYCVVRPCAIYGYGDTHNSYGPNRFLRMALSDGVIRLFGEGEERRDHVYIRDVVRLVKLCLAHRSTGAVNAASGRAISFGEVARLVADALNSGIRIETLPRGGPITHRHFDTTALIRAFPDFCQTQVAEGVNQMVADTVAARR